MLSRQQWRGGQTTELAQAPFAAQGVTGRSEANHAAGKRIKMQASLRDMTDNQTGVTGQKQTTAVRSGSPPRASLLASIACMTQTEQGMHIPMPFGYHPIQLRISICIGGSHRSATSESSNSSSSSQSSIQSLERTREWDDRCRDWSACHRGVSARAQVGNWMLGSTGLRQVPGPTHHPPEFDPHSHHTTLHSPLHHLA